MNMFKKIVMTIVCFVFIVNCFLPINVYAQGNNIDNILSSMTNEEKIAQMIMPAFRKSNGSYVTEINADIEDMLNNYGFAGIILFGENVATTDGTIKLIDSLQNANKNNKTQLLFSIDQEGGYVNRLGESTGMPGNMGLTATNDVSNALLSAKIIGQELSALGIDIDFAPVVDVNNNPKNPIIGVRSFSDDPNVVATYGKEFMKGLQNQNIITSLKHFPGHGDTTEDTHTGISIINKSYAELKQMELIPFKSLIDSGADMMMISHIQYPNIETNTFISKKDGNEYTLPASLSKTIITDILKNEMNFNGIVVSDAMDMAAISNNFDIEDASILAINAGVDILLEPFVPQKSSDFANFKTYISNLASKVGSEIDENRVNEAVKKILTLKEKRGLLNTYTSPDIDAKIATAQKVVSSKANHDKEFEIAKNAVTLLKNDNNVLPIKDSDKTLVLYAYSSHYNAIDNALNKLIKDKKISSKDNIEIMDFTDDFDAIKNKIDEADNVIIINAMYNFTTGASSFNGFVASIIDDIINYADEKEANTIFLSTHLPYDTARFNKVDAIVTTYLSNGIRFNLDDYNELYPVYGPSVMAGIYKIFEKYGSVNGKLPVNIYSVDENNELTENILYKRGYGLNYLQLANLDKLNEALNSAKKLIENDVKYTNDSLTNLINKYNDGIKFKEINPEIFEDRQEEIDNLTKTINDAIKKLVVIYEVLDGNDQKLEVLSNNDLIVKANGNVDKLIKLMIDNKELSTEFYTIKKGSTIAIIKSEYLKTLDEGNHTLTFVYTDGEVSANFMIYNNNINNPETIDNISYYIFLTIISTLGLIILMKKKNV